MESFGQWFQDWAEACSYAQECVPDLSALAPREPYSALASIAGVCFVIWWWNETKIRQILLREAAVATGCDVPAVRTDELNVILDRARTVPPAGENKAA
jgi:hypothetical protein